MKILTIQEVVDLFHPDFVAINNPKMHGIPIPGNTLVNKFEVEYDKTDGILLRINIL